MEFEAFFSNIWKPVLLFIALFLFIAVIITMISYRGKCQKCGSIMVFKNYCRHQDKIAKVDYLYNAEVCLKCGHEANKTKERKLPWKKK